ncbi:MAG: hypothetical protein HYS17_07490 [Micavibrio aeruginosavorus]|uniref:Uncharacterized protein n=1 Tax=Micavibrio aeruginosavorus TaxID=349221 RepID=A0A7T5UH98_9BACT|nr:MAG: hypothetical protein HYS17_07490 [Micavibrio aeruginosavorus]
MALFDFLKRKPHAQRLANISVYYLSEIIDGNAVSSPIGIMPRFSDEYEQMIKNKHQPKPEFGAGTYVNENINGTSVILFWQNDKIEAVNFISEKEARAFPGFEPFPSEDLAILDKALKHFPRKN